MLPSAQYAPSAATSPLAARPIAASHRPRSPRLRCFVRERFGLACRASWGPPGQAASSTTPPLARPRAAVTRSSPAPAVCRSLPKPSSLPPAPATSWPTPGAGAARPEAREVPTAACCRRPPLLGPWRSPGPCPQTQPAPGCGRRRPRSRTSTPCQQDRRTPRGHLGGSPPRPPATPLPGGRASWPRHGPDASGWHQHSASPPSRQRRGRRAISAGCVPAERPSVCSAPHPRRSRHRRRTRHLGCRKQPERSNDLPPTCSRIPPRASPPHRGRAGGKAPGAGPARAPRHPRAAASGGSPTAKARAPYSYSAL
mmetsp:Transcript_45939/g.147624  ORF Transcript_45939/g.147624 Transcript_45939/m.147624 type:complete len:312 (-) Transcript_45939:121-1056(-)